MWNIVSIAFNIDMLCAMLNQTNNTHAFWSLSAWEAVANTHYDNIVGQVQILYWRYRTSVESCNHNRYDPYEALNMAK